ncbi:MAG: serine/threonine protein kinase [Burkholderiales bacterium]|nr:MAG: serine/threonine protein kinase [Burkholderiales bacterium]
MDRIAPFADLTPDAVLNAIDAIGVPTSGTLLALNSYENRVFQVGVQDDAQRFVVAKFYRPGRWTDAQIVEEHAFTGELAGVEVPAVPPLAIDGATLHERGGYRFALYPRRGGRAPEIEDRQVREWLGRFIGRIHSVGGTSRYQHRPSLDVATFGDEPRAYLLASGWLPHELRDVYAGVSAQAIDEVRRCYGRAGDLRTIRLHGDVHVGNVLWTDSGAQPGPHFVDFDDSRMGPAVQDLWMLLSGSRDERQAQLADLLAGYEDFAEFDRRELHLIEALRTLRLVHYSAWIARRWDDPAFPAAFPWFDTPRYWEERILELREQVAAMQEPPLAG